MKKLFLTIGLLGTLTNTFAITTNASWIVETNTLSVSGLAAEDLYESLSALIEITPLAGKYNHIRTKKNSFATCSLRYRFLQSSNGDAGWEIESAICKIKAPQGATINQ